MAADNTVYENSFVEGLLTESLNTKMAVRSMMTLDTSLTQNEGMIKTVPVYVYTGEAEDVAAGADNTSIGKLVATPVDYEVIVTQAQFQYTDEDFYKDTFVLPAGIESVSKSMINNLNSKYFAELAKTSLGVTYAKDGAISYDTIVDAITEMDTEDESGVFVIINPAQKGDLRKDADFKAAQQGMIIYNGMIGTIAGLPVIVSKLCPDGVAYVADSKSVTLFVKKDAEVEQVRVAGTRTNTVIARRVVLVALTNPGRVVEITEALA
jgi:HK97 family phage major capsid protein